MFASLKNQDFHKRMRRELRSGITPAQFELDILRLEQLRENASYVRLPNLSGSKRLTSIVQVVISRIGHILRPNLKPITQR